MVDDASFRIFNSKSWFCHQGWPNFDEKRILLVSKKCFTLWKSLTSPKESTAKRESTRALDKAQ